LSKLRYGDEGVSALIKIIAIICVVAIIGAGIYIATKPAAPELVVLSLSFTLTSENFIEGLAGTFFVEWQSENYLRVQIENFIWIYDGEIYHVYRPDQNLWLKYTGDYGRARAATWMGWLSSAYDRLAATGWSEYENIRYSRQGITVIIGNVKVNPTLDGEFAPPLGAEIVDMELIHGISKSEIVTIDENGRVRISLLASYAPPLVRVFENISLEKLENAYMVGWSNDYWNLGLVLENVNVEVSIMPDNTIIFEGSTEVDNLVTWIDNYWEIYFAPSNDEIYASTMILKVLLMGREMLELIGENAFIATENITFLLPENVSIQSLSEPTSWKVDYGGGTYEKAWLSTVETGGRQGIVLNRKMVVSSEAPTATPEEILNSYKGFGSFALRYDTSTASPVQLDRLAEPQEDWRFDLSYSINVPLPAFSASHGPITVTASGNIELKPGVSGNLDIGLKWVGARWWPPSPGRPELDFRGFSVSFFGSASATYEISMTAEDAGSVSLGKELARIDKRWPFFIGPVPVVVTMGFSGSVGAGATATGLFELTARAEATGEIGFSVSWSPGLGWRTNNWSSFSAELIGPSVSGKASISGTLYLDARVTLSIYEGAASAFGGLRPSLNGSAKVILEYPVRIDWTVSSDLAGYVGGSFLWGTYSTQTDVFSIPLFSKSGTVYL